MSKALPFTVQELCRAWRNLRQTAQVTPRDNTHRLLLFYAVECGLKAVWLKREQKTLFDTEAIDGFGHDLNKLIKELRLGRSSGALPLSVQAKPFIVNRVSMPRTGAIAAIHEVWRYGGELSSPTDEEVETQLQHIAEWITKELSS